MRPLPPVNGMVSARLDGTQQRAWLKQLEQILATQTATHGGPIEFVEGKVLAIDAAAPPTPVTTISANDPKALARSREAIALARGALVWTDVEDALFPAGWAANPATLLRKGAVGLSGDEHPTTAALRRDAALLRTWTRLFGDMRRVPMPRPAAGKLPEGVTAVELVSPAASAVSITNASSKPFHDELRVIEPMSKRTLVIPGVSVGPGESLWLPLSVSIGPEGLCPRLHEVRRAGAHRLRDGGTAVDRIRERDSRDGVRRSAGGGSDSATGAAPGGSIPGGGQADRLRLGRSAHARAAQDSREQTAGQPGADRDRDRGARTPRPSSTICTGW